MATSEYFVKIKDNVASLISVVSQTGLRGWLKLTIFLSPKTGIYLVDKNLVQEVAFREIFYPIISCLNENKRYTLSHNSGLALD